MVLVGNVDIPIIEVLLVVAVITFLLLIESIIIITLLMKQLQQLRGGSGISQRPALAEDQVIERSKVVVRKEPVIAKRPESKGFKEAKELKKISPKTTSPPAPAAISQTTGSATKGTAKSKEKYSPAADDTFNKMKDQYFQSKGTISVVASPKPNQPLSQSSKAAPTFHDRYTPLQDDSSVKPSKQSKVKQKNFS